MPRAGGAVEDLREESRRIKRERWRKVVDRMELAIDLLKRDIAPVAWDDSLRINKARERALMVFV